MIRTCGMTEPRCDFLPSESATASRGSLKRIGPVSSLRMLRLMHSGLSFSDALDVVVNCHYS